MLDNVEDFGRELITPERLDAWFGRSGRKRTATAPAAIEPAPSARVEAPAPKVESPRVEPQSAPSARVQAPAPKVESPRVEPQSAPSARIEAPAPGAESPRIEPQSAPSATRRDRGNLGGAIAMRLPIVRLHSILATLAVIAAVWLATGFYKVEPDQAGVVMRFGRFVDKVGPGLHYHLPVPIESVLLPRVTEINELKLGNGAVAQMLTGDENIVEATAAVSWRISDPIKFLFNVYDPEATVRVAAESAVRQVIALNPIQAGLSDQRQKIADDAQSLLQKMLDFYGAGIQITQVQLQRVDPPVAVIDAFNDVQRARADQQRARNEAEAYRNDILPRARGEAERIKQEAESYRELTLDQAKGAAARFLSLDAAYKQSREITARRLYLDTMEDVLKSAGKVLVDPSGKAGASVVPFLSLNGTTPITSGTPPPIAPAAPGSIGHPPTKAAP
jgi:modulator of FtsH protease HflK